VEGRLIVLEDLIARRISCPSRCPPPSCSKRCDNGVSTSRSCWTSTAARPVSSPWTNLLQELTGEVLSELRRAPPLSTHPQPDGSFLVRGDAPLHEINRELALALAAQVKRRWAGFVCCWLADFRAGQAARS
jgi:hypothetical protein